MNHNVTSREELLQAAIEMIQDEEGAKLNIRSLAAKLGISTGSVYNYFPSKAELVLAVTENFWRKVFHAGSCKIPEEKSFSSLIEMVYSRLYESLPEFQALYQRELRQLEPESRQKGRQLEENSMVHMKKAFLRIMNEDNQIRQEIWTEEFTREQYIEFVFSNLFQLLMSGASDCRFFLEVVKRSIYRTMQ